MVYTAILAQISLFGSGDPLVRLPPSCGRCGIRHPDQPLRRVFFHRGMGHPDCTWYADTSTWKSTTTRCYRLLLSLLQAVYMDTRLLSRTLIRGLLSGNYYSVDNSGSGDHTGDYAGNDYTSDMDNSADYSGEYTSDYSVDYSAHYSGDYSLDPSGNGQFRRLFRRMHQR